jgi:hypothetical protein
MLSVRHSKSYITFETKEAARIGHSRVPFPGVLGWRSRCATWNALCLTQAASFVSIVIYQTGTIIVSLQKQMEWHLIQLQL